jgi:pimeloyl-ACP methyl ester carboxylesterase
MVLGLTSRNGNPRGLSRWTALAGVAPFARHFTVYLVNRRPGLPDGVTMADLAADLAVAIEQDLGGSALVFGTSTGGSVALQLAVDRPALVRRLVLASAACRLGPVGRWGQAEFARRVTAGDRRRAWVPLVEPAVPVRLRPVVRAVCWLVGPWLVPADPADMLATIAAEDAFDVEARLAEVTAPLLVLGGGADPFYTEDLFRRTADGVPDGRAVVLPRAGHVRAAASSRSVATAVAFLRAATA